jgi:hypothetical protein
MNERIKELLNQATTDALYETKDAIDFLDNPVSKQQRELQLEKFAELIVAECIGIVEKNESDMHYDNGMYPVHPTVCEIKEHFGVEE